MKTARGLSSNPRNVKRKKPANAEHTDVFSFDDYDNLIGFVISHTAYTLSRLLSNAIAQAGSDLSPNEFPILNRLHQYGGLTQTKLAALTYKDTPSTSRMLDRLISMGLVRKMMSPGDRRAYLVSLTPAGEEIRDAITPLIVAGLRRACRGIGAQDLNITVKTLKSITSQL